MINGMRTITPSRTSPWEGTPVEGSNYTAQQIAVMKQKRPTWKRFTDRPVKLTSPAGTPPDQRVEVVVQCPIIAWTRDKARVLIICPGGDTIWIKRQP